MTREAAVKPFLLRFDPMKCLGAALCVVLCIGGWALFAWFWTVSWNWGKP